MCSGKGTGDIASIYASPKTNCGNWRQLDRPHGLWENGFIKEVRTMCWEREEPKKASEEIDEILKKIVREAEKEKEVAVPAKVG